MDTSLTNEKITRFGTVATIPTHTVLTLTYNRPDMLREAMISLLCQTIGDWECLVYNDGGQSVADVLAELKDPRIVYLHGTTNLGFPLGYNVLLDSKLLRGKYISYLDDDDLAYPRKLAILGEFLDRHPRVGAVYCDVIQTRNGHVVNYWGEGAEPGKATFSVAKLLGGSFIQPGRLMHRRYDNVRWPTEPMVAGDWEFVKSLHHAGVQFHYLPVTLLCYRWHSGGKGTPHNNSSIAGVTR